MHIPFTKMQGAGNDFVVLDETAGPLGLTPAHYRRLADRHFGVGADQILTVRRPPAHAAPDVDFEYLIHNADGGQVQQCGNGARCFARYVFDKGLTAKQRIRVLTQAGIIEPQLLADGRVRVDMGRPRWQPQDLPFDPQGLLSDMRGQAQRWQLPLCQGQGAPGEAGGSGEPGGPGEQDAPVWISIASMGNPHAVTIVQGLPGAQGIRSLDAVPVQRQGALLESHPRFAQRVNAGFMHIMARDAVALRVYERGAGETLACGTGACAAVVCGIRQGLLDARVNVHTRGGLLTIEWAGGADDVVWLSGPARTVFEGHIELPESISDDPQ